MVNHFRSLPFMRLLCDLNISATTFPLGMMSRKTQALISGTNPLGHPFRKIGFHSGGQNDGCVPSGPMGQITYFCNACASHLPANGLSKMSKLLFSKALHVYNPPEEVSPYDMSHSSGPSARRQQQSLILLTNHMLCFYGWRD